MGRTRMLGRRGDAPPVFTYDAAPGAPPLGVMRLGRESLDRLPPGAHSHDFLVLDYFERGGGSVRLEGRRWPVGAGDVYIVAPGEIGDPSGLGAAEGWAAIFQPEVLGSQVPGAFFSCTRRISPWPSATMWPPGSCLPTTPGPWITWNAATTADGSGWIAWSWGTTASCPSKGR